MLEVVAASILRLTARTTREEATDGRGDPNYRADDTALFLVGMSLPSRDDLSSPHLALRQRDGRSALAYTTYRLEEAPKCFDRFHTLRRLQGHQ